MSLSVAGSFLLSQSKYIRTFPFIATVAKDEGLPLVELCSTRAPMTAGSRPLQERLIHLLLATIEDVPTTLRALRYTKMSFVFPRKSTFFLTIFSSAFKSFLMSSRRLKSSCWRIAAENILAYTTNVGKPAKNYNALSVHPIL